MFPVDAAPLVDGVVGVDRDQIVEVREYRRGDNVTDLGEVAMLPALVNAHTHLEFSALDAPLAAERGFAEWIRQVVEYRKERDAMDDRGAYKAIKMGLQECSSTGTGLLGEIASSSVGLDLYTPISPQTVVFRELLGTSSERVSECTKVAKEHVASSTRPDANWKAGLSPHAPYSTHVDLVREAVSQAGSARCPVAMHLAESLDEVELLASHSGPLASLLSDLGVWNPSAVPRGIGACDYLELLSNAPHALIIHGNYLQPEDWDYLADHSDNMTVVYCPRTHAHFGHDSYPLSEMVDRGVQVALGTDSRATNPDLNLWNEVRHVIDRHGNVSPQDVLRSATLTGARALGLDAHVGSIAVGKRARFLLLAFGKSAYTDPWELLQDDTSSIRGMVPFRENG